MQREYFTLDVFTDHVFTGNPLAVVPEGRGLSDEVMQAIAREFNYSETVFVLPASEAHADCRIRIFTPARELPFAGHPTIGTAVLLSELGILKGSDVVLQEGVGDVRVRLSRHNESAYAELTVPGRPEFGTEIPARDVVARIVGLHPDDLDPAPDALATASCGVPFLLVRVRNRAVLARARGNTAEWQAHLADAWAREIFIHCVEDDGLIRARMFAPRLGIPEDPAAGAGSAALAAYLANRHPQADGEERRTILQGVEMGRPSRLEIGWSKRGGAIHAIQVGGQAVRVAHGTITVASGS